MCLCRFYDASVFETIIRVLGGMLTAHALSGDAGFLTKCATFISQTGHSQIPLAASYWRQCI